MVIRRNNPNPFMSQKKLTWGKSILIDRDKGEAKTVAE